MAKGDCPIVGLWPSCLATSAMGTLCTADTALAWQCGLRAHCSNRRRVSRRSSRSSSGVLIVIHAIKLPFRDVIALRHSRRQRVPKSNTRILYSCVQVAKSVNVVAALP